MTNMFYICSHFKDMCKRLMGLFKELPTKMPFDSTMYSCDISSSHTLISTKLRIEVTSYWFRKK